mgnify:CR=1 FL=1
MKRSDFLTLAGLGMMLSSSGLILSASRANLYASGVQRFAPGMAQKDHSLIYPSPLKPGDTIAIVATAGIVSDEGTLLLMRQELEAMGLKVRFGASVELRHGYFSGTDKERADDLHRMFLDPEVKAIMAVRGGWGTARLIPLLDFEMIRKNPKIFCGFSDNTTLHLAMLKHAGLVSFHGPNGNAEWSELTKNTFRMVLFEGGGGLGGSVGFGGTAEVGGTAGVEGIAGVAANTANGRKVHLRSDGMTTVLRGGGASGPLIGGNLSILISSIGTSYQPETKGSILFAEDIGEPPYKIDRMLTHLKLAGMLDGISGFVFGTCLNCKEAESAFSLRDVLEHHLLPLDVPVVMGLDIGHHERNFTLPVGWPVELQADTGQLSTWLPD